MADKKLVIFTEAGDGIGYGHLMRCLAIAESFRNQNWEVSFHLFLVGEMIPIDFNVLIYNWHENVNVSDKSEFQIALIDSYLASKNIYKSITSIIPFTCAVDDYNRLPYPVSLVLNPGLTAEKIDYSCQEAPIIEGKNYVVLRKEICLADHSKQAVHEDIQTITITVGGSDVHRILPLLGKIVSEELPMASIRIILPDTEQAEELRTNLPNVKVYGRQSADEIIYLFQSSDLVISACGQTLHELAFLGTPFIGILTGDDQRNNQLYYHEARVLLEEIQYSDLTFADKIRKQIQALRNPETRRMLMIKLQELITGKGASNVRDALIMLARV